MSEEQTPVAQSVPEPTVDPVGPEQTQEQDQQKLEVGNLIAESKKYRGRAQAAETELSKLRKEIEDTRISQMEEQEQWKNLAEERANKLAELEPMLERATKQEASLRAELLSEIPEDEHATFGELPIEALRAVVNKLKTQRVAVSSAPSAPVNDGNVELRKIKDSDRRLNWGNILESYKRKSN
jgi:chromosome segregation ATPase